jgi:hypothetical protein
MFTPSMSNSVMVGVASQDTRDSWNFCRECSALSDTPLSTRIDRDVNLRSFEVDRHFRCWCTLSYLRKCYMG